ncbi:MAG: ribulose-phosphate 3-epimerase [Candidatus Latescibacteria bacterium]|nr:ribulose-phosphate 3-epimerase [Candidatus Latescibacterota bacterium]NIM66500.1 ribulose-phosphate 3-epimerase [Candidatus Latescibacterota bacterium]NIO02980.1 ribulose-phosphate 3-epimerase [Candidatus Latescibacterota bacterium]NIO30115.1 ribulose-phosphate 3-epimerase [Candidatus Latescibacterota bacterium]NIO57734.1 ribulose-phosphate 3-epimerase [Candidatus Latescibacterota bacterium]
MEKRSKYNVAVAPSLLSADFSRLGEEIAAVESAGADLLHLDVMDGHFVPNLTFGPLIIEAINRLANLPLDTHLMIDHPDRYIPRFIDSGADIVTIHVEASEDLTRDLKMIKEHGGKCGLSINPDTPLERTKRFLDKIDLLLLMSVFPGFGGQEFVDTVLEKISTARDFREKEGFGFAIQVDGGINPDTAKRVRDAGVDIIVAGTAIFRSPDYARAIVDIRGQ